VPAVHSGGPLITRSGLVVFLGALLAVVACGAPPPPTPEPSPTVAGEPVAAQPPLAVLNFPGGEPTAGDLGTYIYRGAGSDSPWLPGEPMVVPAAGALGEIFLSEPLTVTAWRARVAPAGQVPRIGEGRQIAAGEGRMVFELPSGAWTLQLSVQFGDGIGEAMYYWQLGQG
jgi:hypothetical protein